MRREDKLWDGYCLIQDDRFFKLGQDSVLLSAFAQPPARAKVMDLGCGNGALGVLLCARFPRISVTGLEYQPEVAELAHENVVRNQLDDRMTIVCGDVRDYKQYYPVGAFDYLMCNPPYFSENSGYHAAGAHKNQARQEKTGTLEQFIQAAGYLVKYGGRAAFVHRPERLCDCIALFRKYDLEPKRLRMVHQTAASAPSAVLLEVRRGSAPGIQVLPPLLVNGADGKPTEEYRTIYHQEQFIYE